MSAPIRQDVTANCSACRFYEPPLYAAPIGDQEDNLLIRPGRCRRYTPRLVMGSGWDWPQTDPDDWCGEWEHQ